METNQEIDFYDLETPEGKEEYRAAIEKRATVWAANFEEGGGGDGTPYELGQGLCLWIDLVERWDDELGVGAVIDMDAAECIGAPVCEQVILGLVGKRG